MSDRYASIGFDDYRTEVAPLANAGMAQGSPLSPILFAFVNAHLVDNPSPSKVARRLLSMTIITRKWAAQR